MTRRLRKAGSVVPKPLTQFCLAITAFKDYKRSANSTNERPISYGFMVVYAAYWLG